MKTRLLLSALLLALLFWYQEGQYLLPTPIPVGYRAIPVGEVVDLKTLRAEAGGKPVALHFFNPACPCSRFNMEHFRELVRQYGGKVRFYAVLQVEKAEGAREAFYRRYELPVGVIVDENKALATACGVYSTPQAALITGTGQLYFRGNYNRTRYCTDKQTQFAQQALEALLAGKPAPAFSSLATQSYGCQLPEVGF